MIERLFCLLSLEPLISWSFSAVPWTLKDCESHLYMWLCSEWFFSHLKSFFFQSIDQLFQYLSTNMRTLRERLFDSMYPHIRAELWETITRLMEEQVYTGVRPHKCIPPYHHHLCTISSSSSSTSPSSFVLIEHRISFVHDYSLSCRKDQNIIPKWNR